jgi:hypothetical protein
MKKMLREVISSTEIGVRSSMNTTSVLGLPLLDYKGVIYWIGMPILVDGCFLTASKDDLLGVTGGFSSPLLVKASA